MYNCICVFVENINNNINKIIHAVLRSTHKCTAHLSLVYSVEDDQLCLNALLFMNRVSHINWIVYKIYIAIFATSQKIKKKLIIFENCIRLI